jgi:hypothetical protein
MIIGSMIYKTYHVPSGPVGGQIVSGEYSPHGNGSEHHCPAGHRKSTLMYPETCGLTASCDKCPFDDCEWEGTYKVDICPKCGKLKNIHSEICRKCRYPGTVGQTKVRIR